MPMTLEFVDLGLVVVCLHRCRLDAYTQASTPYVGLACVCIKSCAGNKSY